MMDANLSSANIPESLSDDNEEDTDYQYQIITNNNEVYDIRDGIVYLSYNKDYITYDSTVLETDVNNFEHDSNSTEIVGQAPQDQIIDVTELESVLLPDGTKAYLAYNPSDVLNASNIQENTIFLQDYSNIVSEIGENEAEREEVSDLDLERVQLNNDSVTVVTTSKDADASKETIDEPRTVTVVEKTRRWVCCYEGCEKIYTTLHHLRVHERNHTGSRPFKCEAPGCTKTFATGYSLKTHFRTHSGEKPYACQVCSKCFKTSGDLQKHVRTHTGERPFVCGVDGCNMAFTTSNIRKVHMRTHTGERPYRCTYSGCSKAFASATNFRNHQRIHSGEKPYVCSVQDCSKRFTEYSSLYKHQLVHSQVKQNICNICGKNYRQSSTLRVHQKCVHDIVDKSDNIILKDIKQEPYTIIDINQLEVSVAPNVVNDGVVEDGTQISLNNVIDPSQNIIYVTDNSEKIVKILHTSY